VIAVVNSGSSSIKFTLFRAEDELEPRAVLCRGQIDSLGEEPNFVAEDSGGCQFANERLQAGATHEQALDFLMRWGQCHFAGHSLVGAGHRVVHGGVMYSAPVVVDPSVMANLEELVCLAPLHQPHNLAGIKALAKLHPKLPQVACFDTAFHHTQPKVASSFALPRALTEAGIRRYGFHGLSYEYIASVLPDYAGSAAEGKVVVAHLGQGASMCAMRARRSVATTMGFSAVDGLPMGKRCGALDPGVVLYLIVEKGMDAAGVTDLLYNRSGLLGVSGISGDLRKLLASKDPHAAEAIQLFVYRIGRELGSLVAALGGLDVLVFTGGIGEHSAAVREQVCKDAAWLGIALDSRANTAGGPRITTVDSRVSAWVIPTDEDLMIARHSVKLISAANKVLSAPFAAAE
jgi:acetate kinase